MMGSRGGQFLQLDDVFEVIRIETIESCIPGLALRIHQERNLWPTRSGQRNVVREVIGEPIALPGTEQGFARGYDFRVVDGEIGRRLLEHDLTYIGGVGRAPAGDGGE